MEVIWEDLSKDKENFDSPEWHGDALRQTEIQYKSGELDVVDWDNAKKEAIMPPVPPITGMII